MPYCLRFDLHWALTALDFALDTTTIVMEVSMATTAITVSISISVKPEQRHLPNCDRISNVTVLNDRHHEDRACLSLPWP
jgi:hypothetical protein